MRSRRLCYECLMMSILWMLVTNIAIAQVPTTGLIGYWPFNGNANDMSGNNNHGILEGQSNYPILTTDRFGNANSAYEFGGFYNKNWIHVPNDSTLLLSNQMTVSLWFQQCVFAGMNGYGSYSTTDAGFTIFSKAGDGIAAYPGLWISSGINSTTGKLNIGSANCNGHPSYYLNYEVRTEYNCFDTCEWVHFVSIIDDSVAKIYLNGVLYCDTIISHADYTKANLQDIFIGRMGCSGTIWYPFNGKIDDVLFYNRAITEDEVLQLFGNFYDIHAFDNQIIIDSMFVNYACNENGGSAQVYPDTTNGPFLYALDYANNFQTSNVLQNIPPGIHRIYIKSPCGLKDTLIDFSCPEIILPDNVNTANCTFIPEGTEWSIGQPIISDVGNAIIVSTPMIGDVDDDGNQEIVIPSSTNFVASQINIYNADGTLKSQFNTIGSYIWNSIGLAKVKWQNNEFKTIIVVFGTDKYLYAYDANGTQLWQSDQPFSSHNGEGYLMPAISFADFNHDGWTEVFIGSELFDAATGVLLCKTNGNKGCADRSWSWSNTPYQTMAADLCGDSRLELAVGNTVYNVEIQSRTDFSSNHVTIAKQLPASAMTMEDGSQIPFNDGNTFLADINLDGSLDVVVMNVDGNNRVIYLYVWDVATNTIICSKKITNARKFGTPQIGDLDNNSYPEICFITGTYSDHGTGDNDMIYALKYNSSNSNGAMDVFWSIPHQDNSGSTGLTMFDFNQDGYVELVYRDCNNLRIINGSLYDHQTGQPVSQPYDLAFISCHSATGIEYPVIADVDLDGEVEIIVGGETYSTDYGHVYIFKSAGVPWAPARKVWNQFLYNVTNINKDLTVPEYQFNNATAFTDPQGVVRRPYNNLLQQATTIDQYGRPFYGVPDIAVNSSATSQIIGYDTLAINFSYCNIGDNPLNAPYPITVYANTYGGDTLSTVWVSQSLPVDSCAAGVIKLPTNQLCGIQNLDSLVIAVNCAGVGVAQNGNLQPECDTTNNTVTLSIEALSVSVTLEVEACDSYTWNDTTYNTSGTHVLMFTNTMGCDSIVTLQLTIHYSIETENNLTLCENDLPYIYGDTVFGIGTPKDSTYIFHRNTVHGCDSTATLHLTINPTHLTEYADSICQRTAYNGHGFSLSEDETTVSGMNIFERRLSNQFGCDSVIRLNLYVKPVITPDFYADPDRAMLSDPPVIHFVNNTNTVDLVQANYYWIWDFGDGTGDTTAESDNSHLYTHWGDYTVTLSLWADGCVDSVSVTVFIEADLEFPNVITPNGDGINDVFIIKNLNPDRPNQLYITDRWGKAVWNQKNYQTYMKDGIVYNAENGFGMGDFSGGVYYFTFYYEGMVRTIKFNGSITIIK